MDLTKFNFSQIEHWFSKSVLINNLRGEDACKPDSVKNSIANLILGLMIAAFLEYLLITINKGEPPNALLLGVPVTGLMRFLSIGIFTVCLHWILRIFGVATSLSKTASLCFYAFAGLVPLTMLLTVEPRYLAIKLFIERQDPSLTYLSAAYKQLLLNEGGTPSFNIRVWLFSSATIIAFIWYTFFTLSRVLCELSKRNRTRVLCALIVTFASLFVVRWFLLREVYWLVVGAFL